MHKPWPSTCWSVKEAVVYHSRANERLLNWALVALRSRKDFWNRENSRDSMWLGFIVVWSDSVAVLCPLAQCALVGGSVLCWAPLRFLLGTECAGW